MTQDKVTESLCILDVIDAKTSHLGNIFLNCHSIKISSISASGLKEFYCTNVRECNHLTNMEFEVLIQVWKIQVFWNMTCQLVNSHYSHSSDI